MKITNPKAFWNYDILETLEAGIDLLGPEVKSVRAGQVSLGEAFVRLRDGEAYLINCHIHPYQPAGGQAETAVSPTRSRKLLLHKKQLISLADKIAAKGLTLVPVSLYNKGNLFKLEVGLARGKKKWDKREALKKRDQLREEEMFFQRKA
jgi:SsrA-binding protein